MQEKLELMGVSLERIQQEMDRPGTSYTPNKVWNYFTAGYHYRPEWQSWWSPLSSTV